MKNIFFVMKFENFFYYILINFIEKKHYFHAKCKVLNFILLLVFLCKTSQLNNIRFKFKCFSSVYFLKTVLYVIYTYGGGLTQLYQSMITNQPVAYIKVYLRISTNVRNQNTYFQVKITIYIFLIISNNSQNNVYGFYVIKNKKK